MDLQNTSEQSLKHLGESDNSASSSFARCGHWHTFTAWFWILLGGKSASDCPDVTTGQTVIAQRDCNLNPPRPQIKILVRWLANQMRAYMVTGTNIPNKASFLNKTENRWQEKFQNWHQPFEKLEIDLPVKDEHTRRCLDGTGSKIIRFSFPQFHFTAAGRESIDSSAETKSRRALHHSRVRRVCGCLIISRECV